MAGRGTDIKLGEGVIHLERKIVESPIDLDDVMDGGNTLRHLLTEKPCGLNVIGSERHESRRIDRQLRGRCARQGDPGSTVSILSIEDELVAMYYPNALRWSVDQANLRGKPLPRWTGAIPIRFTQWLLERRHRRIRGELFKLDQQLSDQMAFAGRPE